MYNIELNEQQKDFLIQFLLVSLDEELSGTSRIIIKQIVDKLYDTN
jgi:hypothetical protein